MAQDHGHAVNGGIKKVQSPAIRIPNSQWEELFAITEWNTLGPDAPSLEVPD